MKKLYILAAAVLTCTTLNIAHASGGPDSYGYTWTETSDPGGPAFNWIDITSRTGVQTVTGLADDNSAAGMINIGFSFHYYWNDYTQLKVGSNGWVSFNNVSNMASCFPTIPTPGGPGDNYLAPLMGDLNFTGAGNPGQVRYWTNNVDTFIISYINVPFWTVNAPGWTGSNTFQVILCNSDSSITYQYGALSGFSPNAACVDLTVGIENSTGAIGLQPLSDAMPSSNYVYHFDYPAVVLLSIQDALPVWNQNTSNAAQFIINNNALTLQSEIRNGGNTAITTPITIQATVQNLTPTTVYSGSGSVPTLAANADTVFTFSPAWTPTATGQYSYQTTVTNSQDINSANNTLTTELDVVDICGSSLQLSYNGAAVSNGSINWNGGANDDGCAVYFAPPVYPYTVSTLQYFISSNVSDGFIAQIYDDNGPNGGPGTQLFTTTVASGSVTSNAWNSVTVSTPVTLTSGGFYVVWLQGGTTIFLGTENTGPRSHHNFEILDNAWATYREDNLEDLMIRCVVNNFPGAPVAATAITQNQLTINANDASTGFATSWLWDFGDMTTSTQQNAVHTYAAAGTYTVCLTATSPCGNTTSCSTVTVCASPSAAYTETTAGLSAMFTDASTGTVHMYLWDFGDSQTSSQQNPTHVYATGGTYNVCLIVSNFCGDADTICQTVSVCGANNAAYITTSNALSINFTDISGGAVDTWMWDFGDSNTSSAQSPSHTYATPGTYNVCLIVSNSCGNSDTLCQTLVVCDANVAAFTSVSVEDSVTVTDVSTGNIQTWFWDFGDGDTSTLQNPPPHHYATTGIYTICLITTDLCDVADTICQQDTILITGMHHAAAGIQQMYPNPATDVLTIEFNASTPSAIEMYDATGKLVLSIQQVNGPKVQVDVTALAPGLYTLRMINSGGTTAHRFIKE